MKVRRGLLATLALVAGNTVSTVSAGAEAPVSVDGGDGSDGSQDEVRDPQSCTPIAPVSASWQTTDGRPATPGDPNATMVSHYKLADGSEWYERSTPLAWDATEHTDAENALVGLPARPTDASSRRLEQGWLETPCRRIEDLHPDLRREVHSIDQPQLVSDRNQEPEQWHQSSERRLEATVVRESLLTCKLAFDLGGPRRMEERVNRPDPSGSRGGKRYSTTGRPH